MSILKVSNGEAFFSRNGQDIKIQEITKDDVLNILATIYNDEDEITDASCDPESIHSPAQKIIFNDLVEKFQTFKSKKDEIKDEIEPMFREAEKKYKSELSDNSGE